MKVLFVFGTRPEAIKLAPLIRELGSNAESFEVRICVTGQHREMLDQMLASFDIVPDHDLRLMREDQDVAALTAAILAGVSGVLRDERPDWVFVQGDTTTTFASALAAFYEKIPVAHLEAGLRTGDPLSPWPEEMNRLLTSRIATLHFAPTELARRNLLLENVPPGSIHVTGNTAVDAVMQTLERIEGDAALRASLDERFSFLDAGRKLVLVTAHRRDNHGARVEAICRALARVIESSPQAEIILPVHLNPNVREPIVRILGEASRRLHLVDPLDYVSMVYLMRRAWLVATDSGGIQEEAPAFGVPVLVMREATERPEAMQSGSMRVIGTDEERLVAELTALLESPERRAAMALQSNPYGDGKAAARVRRILLDLGRKA